MPMFFILNKVVAVNKTGGDKQWLATVYPKSPTEDRASSEAMYVPPNVASESLSSIIQAREPKAAVKHRDCSGVHAVSCAGMDLPGSKH
ncbi:hypothetical protein GUITHDRAFT_105807 [Guillardia theta CCMP2712]|uniref:Uncharacterized protein n=1 Tax=Guillardia theta (strain CCMP2712) TaxID=905079 RepID=L1JIP9_GUITC|nr:hypothetical protein GUITHDRAFT_105807 [Guillardia theta CCMP2712]EKX48197.1 hypothetical protein GUITHDRAFT_105807 [Guillardia theta CCMP2712]|eukprot:XP_005835177.1 hypothetical protein GUITHDRAFT_105807 [Guillardia theta CCMP2712]